QRAEPEGPSREFQALEQVALPSDVEAPSQGVDHRVADEADALGRQALALEVVAGVTAGGEEQVREPVGDDTVHLLRHVAIPASTCARRGRTGRPLPPRSILAVTSAHAAVELTSPTTITAAGCSASRTCSKPIMTFAVCAAWDPDPTPRLISGSGSARSRKKAPDMLSS